MTTTWLETAIEAAEAAGAVLRRKFPLARAITHKGWRDIVTDADLAAQQTILEIVTRRFPDHTILSEEGRHEVDLAAAGPLWVIDPLDGTTNYARQFPLFSVAIAVAQGGELQVGVVYDPMRRETFYAARGQGAFARSGRGRPKRLQVSATETISAALIGVDWARDSALRVQTIQALTRIAPECRTVRAIGSAALALASLAAGRVDGYFHLSLQPWDVAAGALLVTESGGRLSTPTGEAWHLGIKGLIASNELLQAALVEGVGIKSQDTRSNTQTV